MSLDQQVKIHMGNKSVVIVLLGAVVLGLVLPGVGIRSPLPLFLKQKSTEFELVRQLDEELVELNSQKQQPGLTSEDLDEIDQKIDQVNTQLAAAAVVPNETLVKRRAAPVLPPLPFPAGIEYGLSGADLKRIPRLYMARMPDLKSLDIELRKERFTQVVLPLVLRVNEEILRQREDLQKAINSQDKNTLDSFFEQYRVPSSWKDKQGWEAELLRRVAPVPVSIGLAQAVIESGWGLSRFTHEGNALYGQWVWNDKLGIKAANQSDPQASVRRFPDLLSSVRAYMFNLNTHQAYEGFRATRAERMKYPFQVSTNDLTRKLSSYAVIGDEYARKLQRIIEQNELQRFETAQLNSRFL